MFSSVVVPDEFPAGSVMVFATWMDDLPASLDETCASGADAAFGELDLVDLNVVLYRADGEERDATGGDGVYSLDGGALLYCGLQGWMPALRHIMQKNDLGHPLCGNLRSGTWALDYVVNRLEKQTDVFPALSKPAAWFRERFDLIKKHVPPFLRPKYFAFVINVAFKAARDRAISLCAPLVRQGTSFVHQLALTSVQMYGQVKSASLDAKKTTPSLAAGLPHFTAGVSTSRVSDLDRACKLTQLAAHSGRARGVAMSSSRCEDCSSSRASSRRRRSTFSRSALSSSMASSRTCS